MNDEEMICEIHQIESKLFLSPNCRDYIIQIELKNINNSFRNYWQEIYFSFVEYLKMERIKFE